SRIPNPYKRRCHSLFIRGVDNGADAQPPPEVHVVIHFKRCSVPVFAAVMALGVMPEAPLRAQQNASPIVGVWTLNKDLSDTSRGRSDDGRDSDTRGMRGGGGGGRGGFGGGFGGGRGGGRRSRGGGDQGGGTLDPDQMARQREA